MSRSYRKNPFISWCVVRAGEEKVFKRNANKALRRLTKVKIKTLEDPFPLPHRFEIDHPWNWPKDGLQRFDPKKWPKGMRK